MRGVGDLPNVNEMTTERVGGSYNVNVDIKLASLRNDYAFNDFCKKYWVIWTESANYWNFVTDFIGGTFAYVNIDIRG